MRRLFGLTLLVLAACSTSTSQPVGKKVNIPEPALDIRQLSGPRELNYPTGPIEIKFELRIGNRADDGITLRRIEISTSNPEGGAYTLERRSYYFKTVIPARQAESVTFWAKGATYGRSMRDSEPVTVKGVLYYETPNGYYNQVFVREVGQYRGDNG